MSFRGVADRAAAALRASGRGATLLRGATLFLVIHVMGIGLAFGVQVLLARALGTDAYGAYVYAYSWVALLVILGRVGLDTGALRLVSAYAATADWGHLRGFLRGSLRVVGSASTLVALALATSAWLLSDQLTPAVRFALLVGAVALPVHALLVLRSQQLRGLQRILASQLSLSILQPAAFGALVLLVLWLGGTLGAPEAMAANAASAALALAFASYAWRLARPAEVLRAPARMDWPHWRHTAIPMLFISGLQVAMQRMDILLVGSMLGEKDAAIYAAASRISGVILFGLLAVNAWVAPMISELHERAEHAELQRLVRIAARAIFVVTLPLAAIVAIAPALPLGLFGEEFIGGSTSLVILAVGQCVNALVGPVGFLMTMTGNQRLALAVLFWSALFHLGSSVVLIPRFGIEGAAVAQSAGNIVLNVAMALVVWKRLRLRATVL